jgi:hypothetical protein
MPERGWAILTVRETTAGRVKEVARRRGLTVDQLVNELLNPPSRSGWSICPTCKAKVKAGNLNEHLARIHPR